MLMSDCTENVTCIALEEGLSEPVSEPYFPPINGICRAGPPSTVECANGYSMSDDMQECISKFVLSPVFCNIFLNPN